MTHKQTGHLRIRPNSQILDEAAEWFVEINEGDPNPSVREQFDEWLRASPEHLRAYLRLLPIWEEGAALASGVGRDAPALIAWAKQGRDNIIPWKAEQSAATSGPGAPRSTAPWRVPLAAAIIAALVLSAWWAMGWRGTYHTATGEQRLIVLEDGSRMELNARSRVKVHLTAHERRVELITGQALFKVAQDPGRPFIVYSGDTAIRAIGTQFDVYKKSTGTVITVVEGRVAVSSAELDANAGPSGTSDPSPNDTPGSAASPAALSPPTSAGRHAAGSALLLSAGQQTVIIGTAPPLPAPADLVTATAWTQQRLVFSHTPLSEVASEFNRYNQRPLLVKSASLAAFKISGSFSSSDPASLLRFLRAQPGIHVAETDAAILISAQ